MNSYGFAMTYASPKSQINSNSYKKYVTLNYDSIIFKNPTYDPTYEPTEIIVYPSPSPPPLRIENNTCICKIERNSDSNILIIATSITSSLCVSFFLLLIWYRFIFKKNLLKWKKNEENFVFGTQVI